MMWRHGMTTSPDGASEWAPEPEYPSDPEFYRRALHYMPSPLLVVDATGEIIFANQALLALGDWDITTTSRQVLDHVHPEDREALAEAFVDIVASPGARVLGTGRSWAEIYFRILRSDGTSVPVELIGAGGLMDEAVGGIIYEVRPARARSLLGRVLEGLSQGASMHQLLSIIATMIASPPLDLDAAILRSTNSGEWIVAASTSPVLSEALRGSSVGLPWHSPNDQPAFFDVVRLPENIAEKLIAHGFQDLWHVAVESPLTANTLRIIATSPTHHVPAAGPKSRLVHARELAAAVLLRTEADVLLEYAAAHDRLTDLPNRAAFYQQAESVDPMADRAAIHLNLDGLKQVNAALGPVTGDAILQIIADRLRVLTQTNDIIGRVTGDEFAILRVSDGSDDFATATMQLAEAVLTAVQDPVVVAGQSIAMATSVGVAFASGGLSTDHLLTWADAAMHDARQAGGGRIRRYGVAFS